MSPEERARVKADLDLTDVEMSHFFPGRKKQRRLDVRIPRDAIRRAELAELAGLTAEERHALDQWCFLEEQKRNRGVIFYEGEPRGEHT